MSKQIETGIPETWFRPLLQSNADVPQGFGVMTIRVAPHFFGSILSGEVTSSQAFSSNLSADQTQEMIAEGNRLHKKFNVTRNVSPHNIDVTWARTLNWMVEGSRDLIRWRNSDVGNLETIPHEALTRILDKRKAQDPDILNQFCDQFDSLRNDPIHRVKLESFVRMTRSVQKAFDFDSSKRAVDRHIDLALNDPTYFICAGEALIPLNDSIAKIAEEEAAIIESDKGLKIPTDVVRWFAF